MGLDYRALILEQYPDAYNLSDAAIVLDVNLLIVFWGQRSQQLFGYKADSILYSDLNPLRSEELSSSVLQTYRDRCLENFSKGSLEFRNPFPINAGNPIKVKTAAGKFVSVHCWLRALALPDTCALILLFRKDQSLEALNKEKPEFEFEEMDSENPWIQKLQAIQYAANSNPIMTALVAIALGLWFFATNIPSISKTFDNVYSEVVKRVNSSENAVLTLSTGKQEKLDELLQQIRNSLPNPNESRVFSSYYVTRDSINYVYLLGDSSSLVPMTKGFYKIGLMGNMFDRYETHKEENCFVVDDIEKLTDAELKGRMAKRFAKNHVSCGIKLPTSKSPAPYLAFLAIESSSRDSNPTPILEIFVKRWAGKVQQLLAND